MLQTVRISSELASRLRLSDKNSDLICRCIFLGYGPAAIASCVTGLSDDRELVVEMSDDMGYVPGCINLEVDRE